MGAIPTLKGLCTYFAIEEIRKRVQKYDFLLIFSIPVAATADIMVSRIGPIATLLLLVHYFEPVRDVDSISTVAATNIENKGKH